MLWAKTALFSIVPSAYSIIGWAVIRVYYRIRELREDRKLKQQDVADYLQMERSVYGKYERGDYDFPIEALIRLSALYECSMDYLVGITDKAKPYERNRAFEKWKKQDP